MKGEWGKRTALVWWMHMVTMGWLTMKLWLCEIVLEKTMRLHLVWRPMGGLCCLLASQKMCMKSTT